MDGFAYVLETEVAIAHADQELLQQLVLVRRLVIRVVIPHAGGQALEDGARILPFADDVKQQGDEGTAEEAVGLVRSPLGHHALIICVIRLVFVFQLDNLLVSVSRHGGSHLTGGDRLQEPKDAGAVEAPVEALYDLLLLLVELFGQELEVGLLRLGVRVLKTHLVVELPDVPDLPHHYGQLLYPVTRLEEH